MSVIHKGIKIASKAVTGDTLPIGTVVKYDGVEVPAGYEVYTGKQYEATELYDNVSGTNANFALSESADDYKYIEIFYGYGKTNNFGNNSCKIYYPYQNTANLVLALYDGTTCQQLMTTLTITGLNVVFTKTGLVDIKATDTYSASSYIKVYRVVGYKEV